MGEWPKIITIRGVAIPVEDWQEMDEVIARYGTPAGSEPQQDDESSWKAGERMLRAIARQNPTDRTLLRLFVEAGSRGVSTGRIGPALGKKGKGIRKALEAWSRRVGLVTEQGASAFEPVKGTEGRGFRLLGVYLDAAQSMLEEPQR